MKKLNFKLQNRLQSGANLNMILVKTNYLFRKKSDFGSYLRHTLWTLNRNTLKC